MHSNQLSKDLEHILTEVGSLWEELRGKRIFITGGTGFFGIWLLESFALANRQLGLNAQVVVLSRNPEAFKKKHPHLANDPAIEFMEGDVLTLNPTKESFDLCIHAATPADAQLNLENPLLMFDTIVTGTRRVLEFAKSAGVKKYLLTSSGAVYGRQPPLIPHVDEDDVGAPDPLQPKSAYGEGKRVAEHLSALYSKNSTDELGKAKMEAKIARCFAFIGPHLPLDGHYAIGNFIRDGLKGGPIRIAGDGTPLRSYLYAADLAVWLWTILLRGESGRAYNVGAEESFSIRQVAEKVALAFQPTAVAVETALSAAKGKPPEQYVPSTQRAAEELGLKQKISLDDALQRTIGWHRGSKRP